MNRFLRTLLLIIGGLSMIITVGLFIQAPWAAAIWPFKASRLSYIFLSSIFAASGAPILWIGLTGDTRAASGGALNLGLVNAASAVLSFQLYLRDSAPPLLVMAVVMALATVGCAAIYLYARQFPFHDLRPTPLPVKLSFGIFAVLLALTGGALVLKRPNIFPWPLSPETSVYYGWIFLGAMVYFTYGLVRPCWSNARGQLLGFLAYDLVLIVPFLFHFQSVRPDLRPNLVIYTAILVFSCGLAVFYLFVYRPTRFRMTRKDQAAAVIPS